MGTSSSYQASTSAGWRTAKGNFTRFVKEGGSAGGGAGGVADSYVRAHGGGSSIASAARPAKATMRRLGSFLGDVARSGFEGALTEHGLEDLIGQGSEAVLLGIANLICSDGATHDEADARHAAIEVFNTMLDDAQTEEDLALLFESTATNDGVMELFELFSIQFVFEKMMRELGERAESAPVDTPSKKARCEEILDYIESRVKLERVRIGDITTFEFNGSEGEALVDQILQDTYEVFVL
jgi:hypothetical protein